MSFFKSIPGWFSGPALSLAQTEESAKGVEELPKITVEAAFKEPVQDSAAALAGRTCPLSPRDILKVELEKIPSLSAGDVAVVSTPCIKLLVDDETMAITEDLERQVIDDVSRFFKREKKIEIFYEKAPSLAERYPGVSEITDKMEKEYLYLLRELLKNGLERRGLDSVQAGAQSLFLLSCFGSNLDKFIEKELKLQESLNETSEKLIAVGTFIPYLRPYDAFIDQLSISINEDGVQFSGQLVRKLSLVSRNPMQEYQIPYCIKTNLQLKDERFEGTIEVEKIMQQEEKEDFSMPAAGGAGGATSLTEKFYDSFGYVKSSLGGLRSSLYASLPSFSLARKPLTIDDLLKIESQKFPLFNVGNAQASVIGLSEILSYLSFNPSDSSAKNPIEEEAFAAYAKLKELTPDLYPHLSMDTIAQFESMGSVDLGDRKIDITDEHKNVLIDVLEGQVLHLFNADVNRREIYFSIGERNFEPFTGSLEEKGGYCLAVYEALKEQLRAQGVEEKDVRPKALSLIFSTCQSFDGTLIQKMDLETELDPLVKLAEAHSVTVIPSLSNANAQLKAQRDSIKLKVSPEEIALNYDCHRSLMYVKMNASEADYLTVHLLYQYILDLDSDQYKGFIKTI